MVALRDVQPFSGDTVAKVSESVRHYYTATAHPLDAEPITLDVLDIQIRFAENRAPHIEAYLTCTIPELQADIDALDARMGTRVEIELGYDLDSFKRESHIVADLMISSCELDYSRDGKSMRITAYSDELRVQSEPLIGDEVFDKSGLENFVTSVLGSNVNTVDQVVDSRVPEPYGASELSTLEVPEFGDNKWDFIDEAQQRTGTWIYCANGRDWIIQPRPEVATTPHHTLTTGPEGTVISARVSTDRERFYNVVMLKYTYTPTKAAPNAPAGLPKTVLGSAFISYGPFDVTKVGMKVYQEKFEMKVTTAQAKAAARAKLARLLSKGHTYDVTALALYSVRPGQTVKVKLFGTDQNLLVQAVTFTPGTGLMDLVLRKPERNEIV
ncbi:hypothetical protein [Arthrobacter sp. QXT-31]|uniref:hypothetical protein n=1 Tax=Arthrobacter sp. QXT-31 TaxID=1357915 RepID=UPI0009718643|nr:hypothetical protein [Arthrobacter sp. QXT-31]APX03369.1 hypothetical protein BWQ92_18060 [Arthrobacter sp. QXT-31]